MHPLALSNFLHLLFKSIIVGSTLLQMASSVGASPQRPQQAVGRRYVDPGLEQARYDQPQPLEAVDELILKIPDFRLSGPSLGEDMTLSPTVPPIDLHHSIRPNTTDDFAPGYVKT
jgi:hypothetical protein